MNAIFIVSFFCLFSCALASGENSLSAALLGAATSGSAVLSATATYPVADVLTLNTISGASVATAFFEWFEIQGITNATIGCLLANLHDLRVEVQRIPGKTTLINACIIARHLVDDILNDADVSVLQAINAYGTRVGQFVSAADVTLSSVVLNPTFALGLSDSLTGSLPGLHPAGLLVWAECLQGQFDHATVYINFNARVTVQGHGLRQLPVPSRRSRAPTSHHPDVQYARAKDAPAARDLDGGSDVSAKRSYRDPAADYPEEHAIA